MSLLVTAVVLLEFMTLFFAAPYAHYKYGDTYWLLPSGAFLSMIPFIIFAAAAPWLERASSARYGSAVKKAGLPVTEVLARWMLLYVISVAGQVVLIDMMFPDMRLGPIRFGEAVKLLIFVSPLWLLIVSFIEAWAIQRAPRTNALDEQSDVS